MLENATKIITKIISVLSICAVLIFTTLYFSGFFAEFQNKINKRGGLLGTRKGRYIIINTTGERILDIYKLESAYVSDNEFSDGLNFKHPITGEHVIIQGDVKVIRDPDEKLWNVYKEYHYDEEFCKTLN